MTISTANKLLIVIVMCFSYNSCIEDIPPFFDPFVNNSDGPSTADENLKYNEIYRKACHNCYEKQYAESLGEALNFTNNIEIDFWETKNGANGKLNGQWYVRHNPITINASGNDNCCTGGPNNTNDLDACLRNVNSWSDAHPNHEVITVFVDKKDQWSDASSNRHPEGFDNLISEIFSSKLYTPAVLKGTYDSPRAAAADEAWPTLANLRGKVIIALTGSNQYLNKYVDQRAFNGLSFVVPKIGNSSEISNPSSYSVANIDHVVFYNMDSGADATVAASEIRAIGAIGRTWGMPENTTWYEMLIHREVHMMALFGYMEESFNGGMMEGAFE